MRIFVVDNGGQWTHREWRVLKYLDVDTEIIPNTTPLEELDVDGLILSGGAPRIGEEALMLGNSGDYLDKADFPIMGICVGAQFMALHFGGEAGPAEIPEFGKTTVTIEEENELFKGVTSPFQVWESHNDEVKVLPDSFKNFARSDNCAHQAFAHKEKPFYGVQFHPEVEHTEFGEDIFKNFLDICASWKK
ncbi:MAG: GMP synthase subunit A [Thermoplasmata archaeon]|nr:GMP synthase subunit A [Thermoplasmata archaeon]